MGLYGPFTAVVGTIQQCMLDGSAEAIYVRNTSIYDLAISFIIPRPVQVSAFGGGAWSVIVPAGDRVGIRVPLGTYAGGNFPGWVWVLPFNNTTALALTGTSSANVNFWIESYEDAEGLPGDYASAQFQNIASQPRVVTVPMAWTHFNQGLVSSTATYPVALSQPFSLTAAQIAAKTCAIYLGFAAFVPDTGVTGSFDFQIGIQFRDNTHTLIGTVFQFASACVTSTASNVVPWIANPSNPAVFQFNGSVPAAAVEFVWLLTVVAGTHLNINYTIFGNVDPTNMVPAADYGTQVLYPSGTLF